MSVSKEMDLLTKILTEIPVKADKKWAIYGTGKGAELLYTALCELSVQKAIYYIIEREEAACLVDNFHDIPVKSLEIVCDQLDGILIGAIKNHRIIEERLTNHLTEKQREHIRVIDVFEWKEKKEKLEYIEYIEKNILKEKKDFVEFDEQGYQRKDIDTKIIAWYLPQFHQIEINNKFHGQGFTEWTNTSRALPLFAGHYQPHIPYDVGYYDLNNPDTLKRQIFLAKHYGIYGFCFHYYWFSGEKLMEKPLELFLEHKELNMPFCLNWATENWTALWDGRNKEIMLEQNLQENDDQKFMDDLLPYMKDSRYIKIDGKPVLILYRVNQFKQDRIRKLLQNFRKIARENGFPDLYIMLTTAFQFMDNSADWGADALVEFPPHIIDNEMEQYESLGYVNPYYNGRILDARNFVEKKRYLMNYGKQTYFRSALTSWDNTARKAMSEGCVLYGLDPITFKQWLKDIMMESKQVHSSSEDIVFVNSWNEWGEGSHLEPDLKYGYAYLQSVKEVLSSSAE